MFFVRILCMFEKKSTMNFDWTKELNCAITVCDTDGIVLSMNEKAGKTFEKWGGLEMIGKCLFDCHNENSVAAIKSMITENRSNTYTIEKNGIKKLIYQTPWYSDGEVAGMVEFSIEIPFEMPHFVRS